MKQKTKEFFGDKTLRNSKNIKYVVFFDTETTDTQENGYVIQNAPALYKIDFKTKEMELISYFEENIKPRNAISPGAAAVHGLWYDDFVDAPTWEDSVSKEVMQMCVDKGFYMCAHNSDFDTTILAKENLIIPKNQVIDTLAIARYVNKDEEEVASNGLQWLRYFYNFDQTEDFQKFVQEYGIEKLQPHTALSDIAVLAYYFKYLLVNGKISSVEEAVHLTRAPLIEDKISFGNVIPKGMTIREAAKYSYEQYGKAKTGLSYLNWAISNMAHLSANMRISISYHIIDMLKNKEISESKDLIPMKFIAATFCPEHKEFLDNSGFDTKSASERTIKAIESKIQKIRDIGDETDDPSINVRELPILEKLLEYNEYLKEK